MPSEGGWAPVPPPPRTPGYGYPPEGGAYWSDLAHLDTATRDDYLMALWYAPDPFFYATGHWAAYPWYRPRMCDGVFFCSEVPLEQMPATGERTRALPVRRVDRTGKVSLGISGGNYAGSSSMGERYRDFGLGLALRYRANEALGLEVSWLYHEQSWSTVSNRSTQPISASVQLYAYPWAVLSPYASAGVTYTLESEQSWEYDELGYAYEVLEEIGRVGPHLGFGVEVAIGFQASLSVEGRVVRYVSGTLESDAGPLAVQTRLGLVLYY